jgi:predicted peroxiredoxin
MSVWKTNDPDVKKILYVQTHGEKDPERTATPFFLATAAAAMDNEVCIYFTMNGPQCVAKDNGDKIIIPRKGGGGKELNFFIAQAEDVGVRFLVCQPSLDLHGYTMDDMREGVEMIGGAAFNDMACDADAVIAF